MSQPAPRIPGSRTQALVAVARGLNQEVRNELIVDTRWHLPFPTVPAAQLLYVPNRVRDIFACPTSAINQSDIDAMAFGILERLNLSYFATQPYEMKAVRDAVAQAEADYDTYILERKSQGLAINPVPSLTERYRNLDAADAELVEKDLGCHPLDNDELPSGTLQKNHIYTELGRTPAHLRSSQRLQAPFARFGLTSGSSGSNGAMMMASESGGNSFDDGVSSQFSASAAGSLFGYGVGVGVGGASQNNNNMNNGKHQEVASPEERWVKQVNMSFKNAKQLDALFNRFLDAVALQILGVKVGAGSAEELAPIREALNAFTKRFLQVALSIVVVGETLAANFVGKCRALVAGDFTVETALAQLEQDWYSVANENIVIVNSQFVRDRFLGEVLALFAEWEAEIMENKFIKISQEDRKPFNETDSSISDFLRSVHESTLPKDTTRSICLVHPEDSKAIPVAIIPVLPANRKNDAPLTDLTARIFLNVGQAGNQDDDENEEQRTLAKLREIKKSGSLFGKSKSFAGGNNNNNNNNNSKPIVMFGDGDLLLRPVPSTTQHRDGAQSLLFSDENNNNNNNNSNNNNENDEIMEYAAETSSFNILKSDDNADGIYLLKVGQDAARFSRVPKTLEYVRRLGTEKLASNVEHSTVVWEDVAPHQ